MRRPSFSSKPDFSLPARSRAQMPRALRTAHRPAAHAVRCAVLGLAFAGSGAWQAASAQSAAGAAAQAATRRYDIPAGALSASLNRLAEQANVMLSVPGDMTAGKNSAGVHGTYSVQGAFQALLNGTGLAPVQQSDGSFSLRPATAAAGAEAGVLPAVNVLGKRVGDAIPEAYAGGQVAQGAKVGMLGNRDYMDTPFSMSSYTEKLIRDQQATSVADLLTTTDPSVRAAIDSTNRYDAITIRGLRVENSEIALNGLYGLVPAYRVGADPVERVEILKGPGALLNGMMPQGSVGGSVNVVTKRADDTPLNRLTAEYGSSSVFGGHADIGRRFGQNGEFGVRVNAAHREGDTPVDEQSRRNTSLSVGLDYRGSRLRVSGDVIYQEDFMRAPVRGYTPIAGIAVPSAPDSRTNLAQTFSYSNSHSLTALGRAEYDLSSNVTLFGAVGMNRFGYDKLEDPGATIINAQGDAKSTSRYQSGASHALSAEAGARTRFKTGPIDHQLVVSGDYLQQTTWFGQTAYGSYTTNIYLPTRLAGPGAAVSVSPEAKDSAQILRSIGVADTLSAAGGLVQLTVGVRRQQVSSRNFDTSGAESSHYDQGATTPSVALVVRPLDQLSFYANYIEALTPGSPPPADAANPNQVFAPFKSKQYEVGTKLDLGKFGATLGLFQIDVPSGIVDPVSKLYSLNGLQRNRGLELAGFGEVTRGVRLLGGVTWLDARLRRTQGGAYDGNHAIGAPSMQATLGAEWDTPFVPGVTLTSRMIYTGKAYVSQDNTQHVPSWTRFDLGGRYTTKVAGRDVTLRANVTNLFNRDYWQANPTGYLFTGAPRTFWLSVSTDL
ncbi:TonB-dependent receptor [Burkholderia lata]|uniref:TonB-dependent receptor n=1 Tax=Burkholderia lata (strain ATCC 17760 / DSM 23089 / LMG 22485 / NCIMB 9086 / R18194 / 383) TaxID=482957 RepID=A0A6P2TM55_BURL3|nr:TonB-dependent receptor [Burkholderia lata]VWC63153.1 TonB-dependent receptor [Burkholderia lata]